MLKDKTILIRMTADEKTQLTAAAQSVGLGLSAWIRSLALTQVATRQSRVAVGRQEPAAMNDGILEPVCRCGHPERKHTPRCYVAGCICRKFQP